MNTIKFLIIFFAFSIIGINNANSQEKYLILEKKEASREKKIKENKLIEVITVDKKRNTGRLHIVNDSTILIGSSFINIYDIKSIKRYRPVYNIIGTGLIVFGVLIIPLDIFMTLFIGDLFYGYTIAAIPLISTGIGLKCLSPRFKTKNGWKYKINVVD